MIHTFIHAIEHTLVDTWTMLPFLFITYLGVFYIERKRHTTINNRIERGMNPIVGSLLGCIPQCGISVLVADMFNNNKVSMGTLLAVFIATSDEALIILLSGNIGFLSLGIILFIKVTLGMIIGLLVDQLDKHQILSSYKETSSIHHNSFCCVKSNGLFHSAIMHTLKTYFFICVVSFSFTMILSYVGDEFIASILLSGHQVQPFISAFIGFIPTCASSVLIAQLLLQGSISFGSAMAGLITNAGFGIIVLIKGNTSKIEVGKILFILYFVAVCTGILLSF